MKICSGCKIEKPLREFHMRRKANGERHDRCKDCRKGEGNIELRKATAKTWREENTKKRAAVQKVWNETHREHRREYEIVKRYGITLTQKDELLAAQGGVCAICGTNKPARRWVVDHDHTCCSGIKTCGFCVRGILCESCNAGIGSLQDNPEVIRQAAKYVESRSLKSSEKGPLNKRRRTDLSKTQDKTLDRWPAKYDRLLLSN
jgi:hypothetical protein